MRALWVTALLAAVTLAGCADGSQTTDDQDDQFNDIETKATSTTGVIRGVVFDPTIVPIAGATVTIKSADKQTTTSEQGAFFFEGLEPGPYFLDVSKIGYERVQASANVEAGVDKPAIVKVQLESAPGTLPFIVADQWSGFIVCSVRAGTANQAGSIGINACNSVANQDVNHPIENFNEAPQYLQSELVWESTQGFGSDLSLVLGPPSCIDIKYGRADGPSPQIIRLDAETLASPSNGNGAIGPEEGICLRVFTYTSSDFAHLYGMQLDQGFQKFTHTFYNFQPDEGWTFVEQGEHPLPQ